MCSEHPTDLATPKDFDLYGVLTMLYARFVRDTENADIPFAGNSCILRETNAN